jgi:hypothetical protein
MSHINNPNDVPQSRKIIVSGFPGSGKSTLSVSASAYAGDTLPLQAAVNCKDVVVINGDSEGYYGAIDCGLSPQVADMTDLETWAAYYKRLTELVTELKTHKDIKYVVVDMALPAKLIIDQISPTQISDWGKVAAEGLKFYRIFNALRGMTIIANCQVKPAQAAVETETARAASEAKAVGGERATFTLDLPKGIAGIWIENASLMLAREVKRVVDRTTKDAVAVRVFRTHTSASSRLEVKSRMASKLAPVLDGAWTLNKILKLAYPA